MSVRTGKFPYASYRNKSKKHSGYENQVFKFRLLSLDSDDFQEPNSGSGPRDSGIMIIAGAKIRGEILGNGIEGDEISGVVKSVKRAHDGSVSSLVIKTDDGQEYPIDPESINTQLNTPSFKQAYDTPRIPKVLEHIETFDEFVRENMGCNCKGSGPSTPSEYKTSVSAKSVFEAVNPIASQELQYTRMSICQSCTKYDNTNPDQPRCKKCGCFLKAKIALGPSECPLKKW